MLGQLLFRAFGFGYGLFNLVLMVGIAAIRDGAFTKRTSENGKSELSAGMSWLWFSFRAWKMNTLISS
jgi:hypothetical protein